MNKKCISVILLSALMMGAAFPAGAYEDESMAKDRLSGPGIVMESEADMPDKDTDEGSIAQEELPFYLGSIDESYELPVYFVNGVTDLPYVNLSDWADIMVSLYHGDGFDDYELYLEQDDYLYQYTRENGYSMLFDFQEGTITFEDYDSFTHVPGDNSLLDMVASDSYDEEGNPILFERIDRGSFDRYGREIELNLPDYGISIYWSEEEELYLVPLQTLGDFLLSGPFNINTFFNEEGVYLANSSCFGLDGDELTPLGISYFSAPYTEMSSELAWYNYCELCLALDYLYGLKEIHDISGFDQIFTDTGYRADLSGTDPNVFDGALNDFIHYYLDDLHSGFDFPSYRTEEMNTIGGTGLSSQQDDLIGKLYSTAREEADHEILSYEEVGNTAYITFDSFNMNYEPADYYENDIEAEEDPASDSADTIALILYAHEQIRRENSPVENVVIDLSLNGGGALDAAAFLCAWYLGEASLSVRSSMTGAVSTGKYRADTNLDGVFDDHDTVFDKRLFCLISPYSFSCGNLVPNAFKSSGRVTLLGQKSGGGSCSILSMSTACGSAFQISSPNRMSYLKNGSYYDTDTGIDPDCFIVRPENYYDREALTEYINQLF